MIQSQGTETEMEALQRYKIELQKKYFKLGEKSLCLNCTEMESDCFDAMKYCDKDKKSGFSTVVKCNKFRNKNPKDF